MYQWTKRSRRWRNGYPLLRMRTASKTPEYRSCSSAIGALNSFGRLLALGLMQRMNIGLVARSDVIKELSCSLNWAASVLRAVGRRSPCGFGKSSFARPAVDAYIRFAKSDETGSLFFSKKPVAL